uniref:Putative secreted protein n=1 Tax=Anopheles darlingi TaxID=43151 RepID=A0A2M4DJ00_ANODA
MEWWWLLWPTTDRCVALLYVLHLLHRAGEPDESACTVFCVYPEAHPLCWRHSRRRRRRRRRPSEIWHDRRH